MKCALSLQRFGVKLFARAALQTGAVRISADCERTAELFVPAAEKRSQQSDFAAENSLVPIYNRFSDSVLF